MRDGGGACGCPAGALQGSAPECVFKAGVQALGPPSSPRWSPLELKDRGSRLQSTGSKEPISHGGGVSWADGVGGILEVNGQCPPHRFALGWTVFCARGPPSSQVLTVYLIDTLNPTLPK